MRSLCDMTKTQGEDYGDYSHLSTPDKSDKNFFFFLSSRDLCYDEDYVSLAVFLNEICVMGAKPSAIVDQLDCSRAPKQFSQVQTVHRLRSDAQPPNTDPTRRRISSMAASRNNSWRGSGTTYSKVPTEGQLLSDYEKDLIRKCWLQIEDNYEVLGQQTYLIIFKQDPDIKNLFGFTEVPSELLVTNPLFQKKAVALTNVFGQAVANMDQLDVAMKSRLYRLGERHTLFRGFGFTPYHWDLFLKSVLITIGCCFRESPKHLDLLAAWEKLIGYIIMQMQEGYDETLLSQNQVDYVRRPKSHSLDTCLDGGAIEEGKRSDLTLESSAATPVVGRRWRFRRGSLPMSSCTQVQKVLAEFRCNTGTIRRRHFSTEMRQERNRMSSGETSNGYFSKGSSCVDFISG